MINYKEIFIAWKTAFNPTLREEELAKKRLNVCLKCDFRSEVLKGVNWSAICGDCGCPLNKKVFSPMFNPCTQKKWKEVDSLYMDIVNDKENKTII